MLYAGVSWNAAGYEVAVVDDDGRLVGTPVGFAATRTDDLIAYLMNDPIDGRRRETAGRVAVESTNGILDGRMMSAGLNVHRVDPHALGERPVLGAVSALEIACAARDRPGPTLLVRNRGTQTGREPLLERWIASSAERTAAMAAAGRCLEHGDRDRLEVALTFDDGPLRPYTTQLLDVLERYQAPATFFCVGMNAAAGAEDLVRMREQGHRVANHTWSHPFLPELTRAQVRAQVELTAERLARVSGSAPPTLVRPPYGARTPEVMDWLGEIGSRIALWDVAPDDWAMPGADVIAARVLEQVSPGSVILLHDGGGDRSQTVAALPAIIEGLLAGGYRIVLVDDLVPVPAG